MTAWPFGVYVHIPFCAARCDYCDFATWTDRGHLDRRRTSTRASPTSSGARADGYPAATSVFFGGGTPSLLAADQLVRILDAIDRADDAEVTVECNPDSVDAAKLARVPPRRRESAQLRRAVDGAARARRARAHARSRERRRARSRSRATRASSASTSTSSTGRRASRSTTGAPRSTARSRSTSRTSSAYALTVEPATPLGRQVAAGAAAPDDDVQADAYLARRRAARRGRARVVRGVELGAARARSAGTTCCTGARASTSGSAAPRTATPAAGAGGTCARPSATSPRSRPGPRPRPGSEQLEPAPRAEEACALALRTRRGSPVAPRPRRRVVDELAAAGFVRRVDDRVVLTAHGRLLASDVTARLLLAGAVGTR